jgi:hypothetical protein
MVGRVDIPGFETLDYERIGPRVSLYGKLKAVVCQRICFESGFDWRHSHCAHCDGFSSALAAVSC